MIILVIFLSSSFLIPNSNNITEIDRDFNDFSQPPLLADDSPILFEGNENALNITDYGNLYKYDQQVSLTNQEEHNLAYYLDDVHNWKVSEVKTKISNIQDTKEWVEYNDFSHMNLTKSNVSQVYETGHDYGNNEDKSTTLQTITETEAIAIRVHIETFEFENSYDFCFIEDENDTLVYQNTGFKYDFFSPWVRGDTLQLYIETDGTNKEYGYYIDYYEYVAGNSTLLPWGSNNDSISETYYGYGFADNSSAMFTELIGTIDPSDGYWVDYEEDDYVQISQELDVPRGWVLDASLSFNYFAQEAIDTNDFTIFAAINGQKIYSLGFGDVVDLGKNAWHSTGNINMGLWVNSSIIFDKSLNQNSINISVGIKSGNGASYGGYNDRYQQIIWFNNISLILTTMANSTQSGINLRIDDSSLNDYNTWGTSNLTLYNNWDSDPLTLSLTTDSSSLTFELDTTLFGYRETTSKMGQTSNQGVNYQLLENGSVYWVFMHNFYMPSQYSDFEIIINKPLNWEIISALDPTLQEIPFEDGKAGDTSVKINTSYAIFPGWWTFKATSPNYLSQANTKLLKQGEWAHASFITGESTRIKTQVNYSGEIPNNIESTEVNLTIFDPEGNQWYSEVNSPLSNGTVFFSEITLSALNTTGGQFEYTLFWSNGIALGGLKSSFIVNHQSQIKLLKPDDAKIDLRTDGFVGNIIPIRVILTDPENNLPISGAIVSYTWPGGTTHNFTEVAIGIYETTLDTTDLSSRGLYKILISSSKLGFLESNLTLEINLGEEFDLIWIIILISALIISALGILSLRSYVILPRRRKKEAELLARTQRFKDVENIQAIVAIHRDSGIPLYSKSYSILEKHKKELFSGFIQAIITVGEEMVGKREKNGDLVEFDEEDGSRTILELDFKYFYCLICDCQDLRIIFILTERASDRLKKQISDLSLGAMLELSEQIENWDGAIHEFESMFPPIINNYVELYFKETFAINNAEFIAKLRKEGELNSIETRLLNVIYSGTKSKPEFYLERILEVVHEKNKDIVIDGIEGLIKKKIIIPSTK